MVRRTVAFTIVAIAFFVGGITGTTSKSAADPILQADSGAAGGSTARSEEEKDAMARFNERDYEAASKLLKEAAKKNPDLPPPQVTMAQWFSLINMPVGVRNSLEQAVIEAPTDPEPYVRMGNLALGDRRFTEAECVYQKADGLMAKFDKSAKRKDMLRPQILGGLAAVAEAREDWAGAKSQLEAWLKFDPKSALALQRLARCLFQQKDPTGAIEKLKEAKRIEAKVLTPEATLALLYEQAKDRENAKKWMSAALKQAPKDLETRLAASLWALETGQLAEAQTQAEEALKIDPNSLEAMIRRSAIAMFQKDYLAAERISEQAHLLSPRNPAATNNLALALVEQKESAKKRRALEYAESNVKQYQNDSEVAATYGWVLYNQGASRLEEADKVLQLVVTSGQFSPDSAYYAAKVAADRNRSEEAKRLLEAALKSTAPFLKRQEAKALLEELKK